MIRIPAAIRIASRLYPTTRQSIQRQQQLYRLKSSDSTKKMPSDEETKAQQAKPPSKGGEGTIFGKIASGEIPVEAIYQDDEVMAFHDVNKQAPIHFLVIPKSTHIDSLQNATDADGALLGKLLLTAAKVANQLEIKNGYRVVINNGPDGCQSVYHLHVHVLAGRQLKWPPG